MGISNAEACRRYRERNLEKRREDDRVRQAQRRAEHREIKNAARSQPCTDCGIRLPPELMDFDHADGSKEFLIRDSTKRGRYVTTEQLLNEIAKCEVRCPNCHRLRHWGHLPTAPEPQPVVRKRTTPPSDETPEERVERKRQYVRDAQKRRRAKHKYIKHQALDKPCTDCYIELPPQVMDFDHVRGAKEFNLGHSASGNKYVSFDALRAEIEKCDVRCPNCHRLRHYNEENGLEHTGQLAHLRAARREDDSADVDVHGLRERGQWRFVR